MLQGIRSSTLTVPNFGHSLSLTGVQRMDGYSDADPWSWTSQQQSNGVTQAYPAVFDSTMYSPTPSAPDTPQSAHRHQPMPTSHPATSIPVGLPQTPTPPPARQQTASKPVKAQPAFRPTWYGYLDTTKDAMTIVEAALQGRLSHISRRPHDKERAQMLTSGTVLVYEENASGIRRWTDAVHWSPSRVMNNCLIYRQLVRALKPEEKRAALNPSCGSKRKRKESAPSAFPHAGGPASKVDDEYEHSTMENSGDSSPTETFGKVYANFAQRLSPEQQRRFCGSLIDSYDFKKGGLMKKTISVKYQGTHHHVISYYSLEDVVSGKLKRPFQDPKLADIQPRPELLSGWKVSLEDEETKDVPHFAGFAQRISPSHISQATVGGVPRSLGPPSVPQPHAPVQLRGPSEYWHGSNAPQYSSPHPPTNYGPPQHNPSPYAQQLPSDYPAQQSPVPQYPQHSSSHPYPPSSPVQPHYPQRPPTSDYTPHNAHTQPYQTHSTQVSGPTSFPAQSQPPHPYPGAAPPQQYPEPPVPHYADNPTAPTPQQPQFTVPKGQTFEMSVPVHGLPLSPIRQGTEESAQQQEAERRASAPVPLQPYRQPPSPAQFQPGVQSPEYFMPGQNSGAGAAYGYQGANFPTEAASDEFKPRFRV